MAIYLQDNELEKSYTDSQTWSRQFSSRYPEFERLADNGLRAGIPKNHPKVNDGTLSSQLTETAMRRFQSLFTGKFKVRNTAPWFEALVNILWNRVIVPGATTDADFYTKFWNLIYRSSKYGVAHWFAFFSVRADYTGSDFKDPYIADIKPEAGKTSVSNGNFVWGDFYFTELDLKNIIDAAENEDKEASTEKRESYNTWIVPVLKEYLACGPGGDKAQEDKNRTEREKETQQSANPYKLSVCFHRGFEAPFITVIPSMGYKVCRRRKNENPSGKPPIGAVYAINNLENPNGKGAIETAGSTQNILDEFARGDVLATQIALEPPVKISGTTNQVATVQERSIVFGPRRKWRVGEANVSSVETNTEAYGQISERFGRYKANLMNQMGSFDTTVPSGAGDPQYSRTPAGVQNLGSRTNDIDNFFIRSYTTGFKELAETLMNIFLANMDGPDALEVTEDEAQELIHGGWQIGDARKLTLDYAKMTNLTVEFIPDTSNEADDKDKQGLQDAIKMVTENPEAVQAMAQAGYQFNLGEAYLQYFGKLKLDHPEKIIVKIEQPAANATDADVETSQGGVNPTAEQPAGQEELQQTMAQYGIDQSTAMQVMQARHSGMPEEEIAARLQPAQPSGGQQ